MTSIERQAAYKRIRERYLKANLVRDGAHDVSVCFERRKRLDNWFLKNFREEYELFWDLGV